MTFWVTKKRALRESEIPRYNLDVEGNRELVKDFPIRISDTLRANSDGVSCVMLNRGIETESSDRYEIKEIMVEAWLSGEGRRYRRKLFMKVQRMYPGQRKGERR